MIDDTIKSVIDKQQSDYDDVAVDDEDDENDEDDVKLDDVDEEDADDESEEEI